MLFNSSEENYKRGPSHYCYESIAQTHSKKFSHRVQKWDARELWTKSTWSSSSVRCRGIYPLKKCTIEKLAIYFFSTGISQIFLRTFSILSKELFIVYSCYKKDQRLCFYLWFSSYLLSWLFNKEAPLWWTCNSLCFCFRHWSWKGKDTESVMF